MTTITPVVMGVSGVGKSTNSNTPAVVPIKGAPYSDVPSTTRAAAIWYDVRPIMCHVTGPGSR